MVFEGEQHVALPGRHEASIRREEVAALVDRFREANFFSLKDEYVAGVTDVPTYRVSISFDGHEKSVMDHFGHEVGMPAAVTALEDEIDRVAGTAKWIEG